MTKATASVRIAHESILAATLQVVREKMQGVSAGPPARPDPDHDEDLDWQALVDQGLITRKTVTNAEVDEAFAGTVWEYDDPEARADPEGLYLDLWIADIGPPAIARALLDPDGLEALAQFREISPEDEPILLVETARHGLVSEDFVRNTAPDWISATQDGLPVALRDSDLFFGLNPDLPAALHDGRAMILRTDRRLGFDPTREWTLAVKAVREHGMFQPQVGSVDLTARHATPARFFRRPEAAAPTSPLREAVRARQTDLLILTAGLVALLAALGPGRAVTLGAGQALTFNGIAQGFATDRVVAILRAAGLTRALVAIGEHGALGGPWRLGLHDPVHGSLGARTLDDGAVATSSPGSLTLPGGAAHILGPGGERPLWSTVSVEATEAALADALSTALCLAPEALARRIAAHPEVRRITLVAPNGDLRTV